MSPGRIPTGRSWRDLPPSPPTSFVPAPSPAPAPVAVAPSRPRLMPFLVGGFAIVLLGFVVGLVLPSDLFQTDDTTVDTSALPDVIVPPAPSFPEQQEEEDSPFLTVPAAETLFALRQPPSGFRIQSDVTRSSPDRVEQRMILTGDGEEIVVFGSASADIIDLPAGDPVPVRGVDGVIAESADGEVTLVWVEPGKILMSITADAAVGATTIVDLAESLEFP